MRLRCEIIKETNSYQAKRKSNSPSRPGTHWVASEGHGLPVLELLKQTPLVNRLHTDPKPGSPERLGIYLQVCPQTRDAL